VIENPHNSSSLPEEPSSQSPAAMVTPAPQVPTGGEVPAHHEAQGGHDAQGNAHEAHHADEAHENELQEAPARDETAEAVTSSPEASVDEKPAHSVAAAHEEEEERGPIEETPVVDEPPKMNWYILKVQSNREESIREGLQRRVAVAGLERYFGDVIVPTEMVSEFKGGKKRVVKRKLYPGYLVVNMEINEETWFLVRETPGIGDFTGSAGKPTPMLPHEVSKIVAKQEEKTDEAPKLKINFNVADRVKINEGTFDNFEGEVDSIDEASGRVTVMINIFGRSTPVELEYWQIEAI
jgi:transcriptional antiterminator NusG